MQDIIDTEFKHCTVLAIMHRLDHIEKYDRVALLDQGRLIEYESPSVLLEQNSRFGELYRSSHK